MSPIDIFDIFSTRETLSASFVLSHAVVVTVASDRNDFRTSYFISSFSTENRETEQFRRWRGEQNSRSFRSFLSLFYSAKYCKIVVVACTRCRATMIRRWRNYCDRKRKSKLDDFLKMFVDVLAQELAFQRIKNRIEPIRRICAVTVEKSRVLRRWRRRRRRWLGFRRAIASRWFSSQPFPRRHYRIVVDRSV